MPTYFHICLCVCVCILIQGFNKPEMISACMFYVLMLFWHAFLTMDHPAGTHLSICSTLTDTCRLRADFRLGLHALIYSDGCEPHASALLTSLPQFISSPTSVWALTVYTHVLSAHRNSWECTAGQGSAFTCFIRGLVPLAEVSMTRYGNTVINAQ